MRDFLICLGLIILLLGTGAVVWNVKQPRLRPIFTRGTSEAPAEPGASELDAEASPAEREGAEPLVSPPARLGPIALVPDERRLVLEGTIRDVRDQRPIPAATVEVVVRGRQVVAQASTDDGGSFHILIPRAVLERFDLRVTAERYALGTLGDARAPQDGSLWREDLELSPAVTVAGRVVTKAGRNPVPGAFMMLRNRDGEVLKQLDTSSTAADGSFAFESVSGAPREKLEVVVEGEGFAPVVLGDLDSDPHLERIEVVAELAPELVAAGRVIEGASRAAVPKAEVRLVSTDPDFPVSEAWQRCDDQGGFRFRITEEPARVLWVVGRAPGFSLDACGFTESEALELELYPILQLQGRAIDAVSGGAVPHGTVLMRPSGELADLDRAALRVELSEGGRFTASLEKIPVYWSLDLEVDAPGFFRYRNSIPATPEGKEVLVGLQREIHLRGRVLEGSSPVEDALVMAHVVFAPESDPAETARAPADVTDPAGAFKLLIPLQSLGQGSLAVEWQGRSYAYRLPEMRDCRANDCEVQVVLPSR